jgi:hypothetical protein
MLPKTWGNGARKYYYMLFFETLISHTALLPFSLVCVEWFIVNAKLRGGSGTTLYLRGWDE